MRPWIFIRNKKNFFQIYDDGIDESVLIANLEYSLEQNDNLNEQVGVLKKSGSLSYYRLGLGISIYKLKESIFCNYVFFSKKISRFVSGLKESEIDGYIDLVEAKNIFLNNKSKHDSLVYKDFKYLLNYLDSINVDTTSLGVEGSLLVGLENEKSDFDLVMYGSDRYLDFLSKIRNSIGSKFIEMFKYSKFGRETIYNARKHYSPLNENEMVLHESRRPTGFITFSGLHRKFSIVGIIDENELLRQKMNEKYYLNHTFQKIDIVTITATVVDDNFSYFRPSFYSISDVRIIKAVDQKTDLLDNNIEYIVDYIGNNYMQSKKGEKIECCATLEKITIEDGLIKYRLNINPWDDHLKYGFFLKTIWTR